MISEMAFPLINDNYKHLHEEYMQNHNGTTAVETLMTLTPSVFSILLSTVYAISHVGVIAQRRVDLLHFSIEFIILVGPLILGFTVLSDMLCIVHLILISICIVSFYYCVYTSQHEVDLQNYFSDLLELPMTDGRKPYITNFRAMTNLLSAICILAVDFKVFPRKFAKTENFGYSVMDIGVGLFCFSNAIIAPEALQNVTNRSRSLLHLYMKTVVSCLPLIALGGLRFFTTKQIDYQMHVSEYGVHWNFFITLAVTKMFSTLILSLFEPKYCIVLSAVIIGMYELILASGVQEWVLSDIPRNTFITSNREGILSSFGYVALYLGSIGVGRCLKSDNPTFRGNVIIIGKFISAAAVFWCLLVQSDRYFGTSRRLANVGYVLWVLTFSVTTLPLYLLSELLSHAFRVLCIHTGRRDSKNICLENTMFYVPITLEAISYNGLGFFLLGNLLTGLVNICIQTLKVGSLSSIIIISCYTFILCKVVVTLYWKDIKLKIW